MDTDGSQAMLPITAVSLLLHLNKLANDVLGSFRSLGAYCVG